MENTNDILELLDILSGMVTEAWGVPLGNDKCIIERDKALEIINEIKSNLPSSISEAKRLVQARDEFIGNAKREAEALRKTAEDKARTLVEQQEIMRIARSQSAEMISSAEMKSNELRRVASEYADGVMQQAENALNIALKDIEKVHNAFRISTGSNAKKSEMPLKNDVSVNSTQTKEQNFNESDAEPIELTEEDFREFKV